jgi:hypothetical protein
LTLHPNLPKSRRSKVWDLADAGLQATSRISQSSDPLALLQEISQVRAHVSFGQVNARA